MCLLSVRSPECGHMCVGGCGVGRCDWEVNILSDGKPL